MTSEPGRELTGRALVEGDAGGELMVLDAPISFWGGVDQRGRIVDVHHRQHGSSLAGKVVVMTSGKGSSSSSSVLAELIGSGSAPAAVILREPDTIIVVGALAAAELYERRMPIVLLRPAVHDAVAGTGLARVTARADRAVVRFH